jgi:hypothetical protein
MARLLKVVGLSLFSLGYARTQVITTVAGTDWSFPMSSLQAADAPLGNVRAVATDAKGNVYLIDRDNSLNTAT